MSNLSSRVLNISGNISAANMSKFSANLAFLFPEKPLLERYQCAKEAGFKAVETGFPYGIEIKDIVAAKNAAGLPQVLINTYSGNPSQGGLGFAAIPQKEKEFLESMEKTIEYAKALGVKKIHIMAGKIQGKVTSAHDDTYKTNLELASKLLEKEDILGLIEPINPYAVPHYYLNSYDKAISMIRKINSPNLKLMLDIFHLQMLQGNLANSIKEMKEYIGHVQIAQVPNRNEPTSDGEINYKFVLETLKKEGYDDWIGLEYKPLGDTKKGLKWIQDLGYSL